MFDTEAEMLLGQLIRHFEGRGPIRLASFPDTAIFHLDAHPPFAEGPGAPSVPGIRSKGIVLRDSFGVENPSDALLGILADMAIRGDTVAMDDYLRFATRSDGAAAEGVADVICRIMDRNPRIVVERWSIDPNRYAIWIDAETDSLASYRESVRRLSLNGALPRENADRFLRMLEEPYP